MVVSSTTSPPPPSDLGHGRSVDRLKHLVGIIVSGNVVIIVWVTASTKSRSRSCRSPIMGVLTSRYYTPLTRTAVGIIPLEPQFPPEGDVDHKNCVINDVPTRQSLPVAGGEVVQITQSKVPSGVPTQPSINSGRGALAVGPIPMVKEVGPL